MTSGRGLARTKALGDRALIVDLPDLRAVLALEATLDSRPLAASRPEGIEDVVPAARTLAVLIDPRRTSVDAARTWLQRAIAAVGEVAPDRREAQAAQDVTIDVVYDGEDLADVERLTGIPTTELVRRHTAATWHVAFGGFAPGFGYLVTDDDWPDVPRRTSPRTRVPSGSVALAGTFSGAYPREGAGGWQLIGRTDAPLWRPADARPALLAPGTRVRFRAVDPLEGDRTTRRNSHDVPEANHDVGQADRAMPGAPHDTRETAVTVVHSGPQLLIEDLGRPGYSSVGAGRSGALDRAALRLANRLVGNDEACAGLEVVVTAEVRFERAAWFAVTGARGGLRLGGHPIEPDEAVHASAGDVLQLGVADHGLRYYVALRGGVDAPLELGSASTDLGAGLGPAPLVDGGSIVLGQGTAGSIPAVDALTVWSPPDDEVDIHVVAGPRAEWFSAASVEAFYGGEWEVTQKANRVGVRLRSPGGVALRRSDDPTLPAELPSEPMVPGAVQVPPSGEPTVLLADGPVTGGYPVIAVVTDADLDLFAQLRPGQRLRFRHARSG